MSYPGNPPSGNPNEAYGYQDPNAANQYGAQPVNPAYGQPVPPQPAPLHDQSGGTAHLPAYGAGPQPNPYNLDGSVSAPPTPPVTGPPMSGPPMSGPPAPYGPTSGAPGYGDPMFGPAPQPAAKKSVVVPILAGLLALAVIAAGVFVGLYVDKSGKLDKSEKLASQRQNTVNATQAELDTTKNELKTKADELAKLQQELRGTQADNTEAKRQRDVIGKCLTLLLEALSASNANNRPLFDQKAAELKKPCNEANVLLGI